MLIITEKSLPWLFLARVINNKTPTLRIERPVKIRHLKDKRLLPKFYGLLLKIGILLTGISFQ
jgi:hypothetical protein